MAYEYERIIGLIDDLIEGDGSPKMAAYIDCPKCGSLLNLQVQPSDRTVVLECSRDRSHMAWSGHYDHLPAWIDDYRKLNT